jgi:CubicO group peptidase (beta-lactamase class C family)
VAIPQNEPALCGLAWAAKVMASGAVHTGRDPLAVFRESCNWMAAPDDMMRTVRETRDPSPLLSLSPDTVWQDDAFGVTLGGRTAWVKRIGAQGVCVVDGPDAQPHFTPTLGVTPPDISALPWPRGDDAAADPACTGANGSMVQAAEELAFANPRQMTNALLVLHRGRIILERYRAPFDRRTRFESWSMGKTIAATLVGVAQQQGLLDIDQPCGFDAWRKDARAGITPRHLLNMASGLAFTGSYGHAEDNLTKQLDGKFLDHIYVYAGGVDSFSFCVEKRLQDTPGAAGRYRNCDPLLATALVRERACDGDVQRFLHWPYEALLHRIGAVGMLLETDPYGHFLISGHDYGCARDWARLGQLHLQRGAWEGEQLFSEAFAELIRTPAADAWRDDPTYGGFVYVNATGHFPTLPKDAFVMSGGGRQRVVVVPSMDLVMVRLGHINGMMAGLDETLNGVYGHILAALAA